MNLILTLFYFILALLLLIVVHEAGHFIVARCCGVKVLRFSLGFGKVLASWRDKRGTEYAWSLIPLGGYVKMLDEAEGEVLAHERHLAFNNKSLGARIAIVVAGPLFNFLFAFFALWLVLVIGIQSLAPMIDGVKPDSIAAKAGLTAKHEIIAVDSNTIASWRDFQYALMPLLGGTNAINLTVKSLNDGAEKTIRVPLLDWQMDTKHPDLLDSLGIIPFVPRIPPVVGEIMADSPAQTMDLLPGDQIVAIDAHPVKDWLTVVEFVRQHPQQSMVLHFVRQGQSKQRTVMIGSMNRNGHQEGYLGLRAKAVHWPAHWLRLQREAPIKAMGTAFDETIHLTKATFAFIGRLITGKLSLNTLSGPVGIAQGAGESARGGLSYYLSFLALVSISIGVLNLLPIPLLDGGHLLYYLLEFVCRRRLSEQFKSMGVYIGLVLLVTLMAIALSNDLARVS